MGSAWCAVAGSPTGQQLTYDVLGRLLTWQNASTNPTATGAYAYDGEGERVWQQDTATVGSTTTTTTVSAVLGDEVTFTVVTGHTTMPPTTRFLYPWPGAVMAVWPAPFSCGPLSDL